MGNFPLLCAGVLCAWAASVGEALETSLRAGTDDRFDSFVQVHRRAYRRGSAEYKVRRALFEARLAEAELHNGRPGSLWRQDAFNAFADRSPEELSALLGWKGVASPKQPGVSLLERGRGQHREGCELPDEWSWAYLNSTRRFRNQGVCGSCSALATTLALEAHHEIYRGVARTFSPQEFISCVQNPEACGGNGGCEGGFMELVLSYAVRHGCHSEADYPGTSDADGKTGRCKALPEVDRGYANTHPGVYKAGPGAAGPAFGLTGYERLPANRAAPLMRALVERGPAVVALAARGWFAYGGGIFDSCAKDAVLDHAVLLLGFGKENGRKYWLIQNSWGQEWGESGRLRLLRRGLQEEEEEWCGVDRQPELGAACSKTRGGAWRQKPLAPVEVCGTCGLLYNPVVPHFEGRTSAATKLVAARARCAEGGPATPAEFAVLVK